MSPTGHSRHTLPILSSAPLSPFHLLQPPSILSHSLLEFLALVQRDLLGRRNHLACGWVWVQILPIFFLSRQWHLTVHLLLRARHALISLDLPSLALAYHVSAKLYRCHGLELELRGSPSTFIRVMLRQQVRLMQTP